MYLKIKWVNNIFSSFPFTKQLISLIFLRLLKETHSLLRLTRFLNRSDSRLDSEQLCKLSSKRFSTQIDSSILKHWTFSSLLIISSAVNKLKCFSWSLIRSCMTLFIALSESMESSFLAFSPLKSASNAFSLLDLKFK